MSVKKAPKTHVSGHVLHMLPGKVTLPQLSTPDGPCVFVLIPSVSLVRETLTTQSPGLCKALASPVTATSGTALRREKAILSRKTQQHEEDKDLLERVQRAGTPLL